MIAAGLAVRPTVASGPRADFGHERIRRLAWIRVARTLPAMRGLLLIDHGSRRDEANAQLVDMAERVRRLRPGELVGHAHLELAEPSIAAGFAALVAAGADEIHALLYFLGAGRHSRDDIPRLLAAAAAPFPCVRYALAAPLGPHDLLARLLVERAGLDAP